MNLMKYSFDRLKELGGIDNYQTQELIRVCGLGYVPLIQKVLEKGADINTCGSTGLTPLGTAASKGKLKAVKFLIEQGTDPEYKDTEGLTALERAENIPGNRCKKVVEYLNKA